MSFEKEHELSEQLWRDVKKLYPAHLLTAIQSVIAGKLPRTGFNYVARCLKQPARNVESSIKSSAGRFPSNKIGRTIAFESGLEYLVVIRHERDPRCIALLDQGHAIKVAARSGAMSIAYQHTPDFVCISIDGVKFIECKTFDGIREKNEANPGFFVFEDGRWMCPTAQAEAKCYGFNYEVWTDRDFSDCELRNSNVIAPYLCGDTRLYDPQVETLRRYLDQAGRSTLSRTLDDVGPTLSIDGIYAAIARLAVAFNVDTFPLTKLESCEIFRDDSTMGAYERALAKSLIAMPQIETNSVSVEVGTEVMWNACRWRCVGINETAISFIPNADVQPQLWGTNRWIPVVSFLSKLKSGEMTLVHAATTRGMSERAKARLQAATSDQLAEAVNRNDVIAKHLEEGGRASQDRSVRRWIEEYRKWLAEEGCGFAGLIPRWQDSGNRSPRLEDKVVKLAAHVINDYYLTPDRINRLAAYKQLLIDLEKAGYRPPSYKWFCGLIKSLPDYETKLAREGSKSAYRFEPRVNIVDHDAVPIAERAMELAHLDHTKIDLVVKTDGKPIRLWLTVMICAASRRVLAAILTFEPPSYRLVMLAVRDCVKRYCRLPRKIMVDGGKEFRSTWCASFCATYHVQISYRPKSKARYGAQIERLFGTINTQLLYRLMGNTQNTRNVRQMTAEVDPYKRAVLTAHTLREELELFLFADYDNKPHTGIATTPRLAFESSVAQFGSFPHLLQTYDETFLILSSGTSRTGKAKIQNDGVKIKYFYYNHPALRFRLGQSVPVRFDPSNVANAWVQIDGAWLKVTSRHASVLVNHSEHDVAIVTGAWRLKRSDVERAKLAEPEVLRLLKHASSSDEWREQRQLTNAERLLRAGDASVERGSHETVLTLEAEAASSVPDQSEATVAAAPTLVAPKRVQRLVVSDELFQMEMAK